MEPTRFARAAAEFATSATPELERVLERQRGKLERSATGNLPSTPPQRLSGVATAPATAPCHGTHSARVPSWADSSMRARFLSDTVPKQPGNQPVKRPASHAGTNTSGSDLGAFRQSTDSAPAPTWSRTAPTGSTGSDPLPVTRSRIDSNGSANLPGVANGSQRGPARSAGGAPPQSRVLVAREVQAPATPDRRRSDSIPGAPVGPVGLAGVTNGVESSRRLATHAAIPGVMDTQLAMLIAVNEHLKEEMRSEEVEHEEQIELMKAQLTEMSRERTWEMAAFEERSERLASEKAEMLIETDELLDYHDLMQSEQNKSAEIFAEAYELQAATTSQAKQLISQAAELASASSEVTKLRDQLVRLQAEKDEAVAAAASACSKAAEVLLAEASSPVSSGRFDSQEELEVVNEKLNVAHAEIAGLEDECGESSKKAEKAAIENEGLRAEVERLRLELSEAVDKAAINGERLEGELKAAEAEAAFSTQAAFSRERLQHGKLEAAEAEEVARLRGEVAKLWLEKSQEAEKAAEMMDKLTATCRGELEKLQAAKTVSAGLRGEVKRLEDALIEATTGSDADNTSLRSEILKMSTAMEKQSEILQEKTQKLEASEDREIDTQLKLEAIRLEKEKLVEAASNMAANSGGGSESRLRAVMTSQNVPSDELKSAIGAVEALVDEARRELERKQLRERRAAFEQLGHAQDKADEALLEAALVIARRVGLDDNDIVKAEAQLLQLRSMSEEQKAARTAKEEEVKRKKEAFIMVKKDDAEQLQQLIAGLPESVRWQDWRDYAGRTLWRCAQDLRAERVQPVLASLLGMNKSPAEEGGCIRSWKAAAALAARKRTSTDGSIDSSLPTPRQTTSAASQEGIDSTAGSDIPRLPNGRASVNGSVALHSAGAYGDGEIPATASTAAPSQEQAETLHVSLSVSAIDRRPVPSDEELVTLKAQALRAVVQDDPTKLEEVFDLVPEHIWSIWQNKAGKDLITLSEERGSSLAYGVVAKALGLVIEVKRDTFEEREDVWIFSPGDVVPSRATVMEDTSEEAERILIEYWDGDAPASYVDRCMVRKIES